MKFILNGVEWIIKEVSQKEMFEEAGEEYSKKSQGYYFGKSLFYKQEIWLSSDLSISQKRKILIHELTHCYIKIFITFDDIENFNEEMLCDIHSNSHDIIHKIVEDYFKVGGNEE